MNGQGESTFEITYSEFLSLTLDTPAGSLAWSPDGTLLAVASKYSEVINVFNVLTSTTEATFNPELGPRLDLNDTLAWSPDGATIAIAHYEIVHLWNISTDEAQIISLEGKITSISWDNNSDYLAIAHGPEYGFGIEGGNGNRRVTIWDVNENDIETMLQGETHNVWSVNWSPDGTKLATFDSNSGLIRTWSAEAFTPLQTLNVNEANATLAGEPSGIVLWSPDSRLMAGTNVQRGEQTYFLWTWDIASSKVSDEFQGRHDGLIHSADWSADGSMIASGGLDHTVKLWDVATGALLETITDSDEMIASVRWSPNGSLLAASSWDGIVRIWHISQEAE